jgi:DNA-binding NtrC family response regulator
MNHSDKKIILINVNDANAATIDDYLMEWGYTTIRIEEVDHLKPMIHQNDHALILFQFIDFSNSEFDLFRLVQKENPSLPIVFACPYISVKDSFNLGKAGAVDYIIQPFNPSELKRKVEKHLSNP